MLRQKKISFKTVQILFISTYLAIILFISAVYFFKVGKINKLNNLGNKLFEMSKISKILEYDLYKLVSNNYDIQTINDCNNLIEKQSDLSNLILNSKIKISKKNKNKIQSINTTLNKYKNTYNELISNIYYLYEPNTGLYSKIKTFENYIENNQVFINLGFDKYYTQLKEASIKLLKNEITQNDFERKYIALYNDLNKLNLSDSKKNSLLLFQNYFSQYYQFILEYYAKKLKIGRNINEGYFYTLNQLNNDLSSTISSSLQYIEKDLKRENTNRFFLMLIFLLIAIAMAILSFLIANRQLNKTVASLVLNLKMIARGHLYSVKYNSFIQELNSIELAIHKIVNLNKRKIDVINQLANQSLDIDLDFEEEDELGMAIKTLHNSLIEKEKETLSFRNQQEQQKWQATGLALIGATMRKYTNDLTLLYENVLKEIIEYTDSLLGAIYTYNENENVLELAVAYHYGKKRTKKNKIAPYEGILGTILIEKKPYYFCPVPDDYIFLEMGTGYTKPTSIFIFPLLFENKIYGVIEIASLNEMQDYLKEFFLKLANEFAITISYTIINVQTNKLLKEFEKQTEELKQNEKFFKKNQQHLKSIIRTSEQKYSEKENELQFKENVLKQKIQELIETEQELAKKEEQMENIINDYENQKAKLVNENKELRARIEELEKRLRKK